jgi:CheY-like chemotaxis protein
MPKILLVDDEWLITMSMGTVLQDEGYDVISAADGAKGLELALSQAPDLIITDHMMPRMDGLTMAARIREKNVAVPILLATAVGRSQLPAGREKLVQGYLSKPVAARELLSTVKQLLKPA